MQAVSSSDFIKEFTLYAEKAVDKKETFIIQRASGKNVVLLSMDEYNDFKKKIYEMQQRTNDK